jgi:hypothetical protein
LAVELRLREKRRRLPQDLVRAGDKGERRRDLAVGVEGPEVEIEQHAPPPRREVGRPTTRGAYCSMEARPLDTTADMAARQFDLYRQMTAAEKARRVSDLTRGSCVLALAGLRRRYPNAGEPELLLRLTALRLGAEIVTRAYGWPDGA